MMGLSIKKLKKKNKKTKNKDEGVVKLDGQEIPKSECF